MTEVIPKVSMDARTDQALAAARDMRAGMARDSGAGDRRLALGDEVTARLREQFPAMPELGRVTLAVAASLEAVRRAGEADGAPLTWRELAAVAGLAAEQLDREGAAT